MSATSPPVGPVTDPVDPVVALASSRLALAALRGSQCYQQYKKNGTLPRTKLGECEQHLLAAIKALGG